MAENKIKINQICDQALLPQKIIFRTSLKRQY